MQLQFQIIIEGGGSIKDIRKALKLIDNHLAQVVHKPELADTHTGGEYNDCTLRLEISPIN